MLLHLPVHLKRHLQIFSVNLARGDDARTERVASVKCLAAEQIAFDQMLFVKLPIAPGQIDTIRVTGYARHCVLDRESGRSLARSAERRVGKECAGTLRFRWCPQT